MLSIDIEVMCSDEEEILDKEIVLNDDVVDLNFVVDFNSGENCGLVVVCMELFFNIEDIFIIKEKVFVLNVFDYIG